MQVTRELAASPTYDSVIPAQAGIHLEDSFPTALNQLLHAAPAHIAIALSGGADSMALALLAQRFVQAQGGALVTLTVDHGLRAESAAEAAQVAAWMQARGIAHHILTPAHCDASNNLQEAARQWRYDALAEFCQSHGILHCLLAHQAGDNRETVALNTARGTTADGGSGMARVRNYRGVRFLRPLLSVERSALEAYLHERDAPWVNDPSNHDPKFARVRARTALADDSAARAQLDETLRREAAARTARDHALADVAMRLVTLHPLGFGQMSLAAWQTLDAALATQLLADLITTISGATHRPRVGDTQRLAAALRQPAFRKRSLQHCEISLRGDIVCIAREAARVASPITLSGTGTLMWDGRFRVQYDLSQPLSLRALGTDGRRQLPAARSLPLATPTLWHLDELRCVPHITAASPNAPTVTIGFAPPKPLAAAPFW